MFTKTSTTGTWLMTRWRRKLNRLGLPALFAMSLLLAPLSVHGFIGPLNLFIPLPSVEPVAWERDGQDWHTRSSAHFILHYPEGLEAQAEHALGLAEQVHDDLLPFFGQAPDKPTVMVLEDDVDYSNGWATPVPYAQIRLFASPPDAVEGLETYDDWLHLLIRHEYVHILHMEMSSGLPDKGRSVLGRHILTFPHAMTPSFLLEGLAVYLETNPKRGYGRLQGSLYEMQMREEVASGQLAPLTQVVVPNRDWPRNKAYLYGAFFIEFLVQRYGEDKLQAVLKRYSLRPLPYLSLNGTFKRIYRHTLSDLWSVFLGEMKQRFNASHQRVSSGSTPLPGSPWSLQVTQTHQDALYSLESNGEDAQAIWRYQWQSGQVQKTHLLDVQGVRYFDVSSQGQLAYVRVLARADLRVEGDVYYLDASGSRVRLSHGLRARRVQWLPDGSGFLVSRIQAGHSELLRLSMTGEITPIWRGEYGEVLGEMDVSPNGKTLVASFKRAGEHWNLARFDLTTKQWRMLTRTRAIENAPVWLNDHQILFSADYQGVYNLYRYDLGGETISAWTQESSGAFRPGWLPGRLVYQRYTANGYQLVVREADTPAAFTISEQPLAELSGPVGFDPVVENTPSLSAPEAYRPWSSLKPTAWYPALYSSEHQLRWEIAIPGSDALGRHAYVLKIGYDRAQRTQPFSVQYQYDNRWWLLGSRGYEHEYGYNDGNDDDAEIQTVRRDVVQLERRYLMRGFDDRLSVHLGLSSLWEVHTRAEHEPWRGRTLDRKVLGGIALEWTDQDAFLYVPGVGRGTHWDWVTERYLHGEFDGYQTQWRGQRVFDLPGRTRLATSVQAGWAQDSADRFELGGLTANTALFGRHDAALAGYGSLVQHGHRYTTQRVSVSHWLGNRERNWRLLPIGLGAFSGTLFAENGAAWESGTTPKWLASVGVELQAEVILGYNWTLPLSLILAQGLDDRRGENSVGLALGYRY